MQRSNSRYKSTVHVVTSARDHPTANNYRRRRPESDLANTSSSSSYSIVSYHRPHPVSTQQAQLSSRTYQQNHNPISVSSRSISSSLSNRRITTVDVPPSTSTYSSLITLNNRPSIPNPPSSIHQAEDLTRGVSIQGKRCSTDSTDSTKVSNHLVIIPKSKSNNTLDKPHHISCPIAYPNPISLGTITILSDSSSDNTILHHLPDQNETTDKSQQSLHDERLHRSPRKPNHFVSSSRVHSTSSIDEQKRPQPIPSIHYTIEPIEVHGDLSDENHQDFKQKAIREEKKRKANENEQVLINVDEYASEIIHYLREREVNTYCFLSQSSSFK